MVPERPEGPGYGLIVMENAIWLLKVDTNLIACSQSVKLVHCVNNIILGCS